MAFNNSAQIPNRDSPPLNGNVVAPHVGEEQQGNRVATRFDMQDG
jgi:hypothetical protein